MGTSNSGQAEGMPQAISYGESQENSKIMDQVPLKKLPSERSMGENHSSFPDNSTH